MDQISVLIDSILQEIEGAESEIKFGRYKNALILYSKALFSMCDYLIAVKRIKLPRDHDERFRILERYFPEIYKILDKLFRKYTDTYLKPTEKESCEGMKNAIKKFVGIESFDAKIKTFIEKI